MYQATPGPPGSSRHQSPHYGLLIAPAAPIRLPTTTGASHLHSFKSHSSQAIPRGCHHSQS
ncbi:hypothetical protein CCUS01_03781 [Colletotrichum cuscutae]|uniref:Uncharacterized protein n=1 Tax=Colletotrichum cuscutae TaxID=1209917 RepID=A0AAI9Y4R0_9PEZI|nr:hypothetical protein CCUS01_03781 [Colletotrichum cuscutae]